MEGLIVFGIIIIVAVVFGTYCIINNKHLEITKKYSKLYKNIIKMNSQFRFYDIKNSNFKFNATLKSKRSLENLDLYEYVKGIFEGSFSYYNNLFNNISKNINDYHEYKSQYKSIEKYADIEEYNKFENIGISYKEFIRCEKSLYKKSLLKKPVTEITAHCHASYTSPSGRNHYWKDRDFSFTQLIRIINEIKDDKELKDALQKRKMQIAEEKRAKEKKLRELDKFEKRLVEKEKEINKKEKEFIEATKEHIYTTDKVEIKQSNVDIDENLTLTQKLKLLKEKFDNGEISYEEYQTKRKELM